MKIIMKYHDDLNAKQEELVCETNNVEWAHMLISLLNERWASDNIRLGSLWTINKYIVVADNYQLNESKAKHDHRGVWDDEIDIERLYQIKMKEYQHAWETNLGQC